MAIEDGERLAGGQRLGHGDVVEGADGVARADRGDAAGIGGGRGCRAPAWRRRA